MEDWGAQTVHSSLLQQEDARDSLEACLHDKNNAHWMRINSNWSRPHGIRIDLIRIETELSQSTSGGGLNANCKWIGKDDSIVSSQFVTTWGPTAFCV